jgi:EAL domain-containing protein (putative c-di-GMP-specific phosphodiesterase class I)
MSERFSSNISSLDTVCRIEGNEFLILFDGIQRKKFVKTVVDNFLKYSTVDFELNTHKLKVYLSAGVAIYPDDGLSLDSLIQHAGKALYEAKKIDTTSFHFYNTQLEAKHKFKAELKEDVINGILNNEFCVYYQPIINAKSHEIESLEVHVYWQKKQQLIDTNKYFSIAKETNLMSIWVNAITEEALKHFKVWLVHNPNLMLSFNLTQILLCDEKFASKLLDLLEIHQIPAKNIEVLISEPTLVAEREYFKELLNVLHRFGFSIVLDSFGTANASFCYLQEVYFDGFIIPPKYTHELTGQLDMNETAIVVVNLAKGMNVNCTAKGIENVIQAKVLSLNGCKQLQGDYFSKPLPFEKVSSQLLKGCSLNK